jgi:hypothetical protein
MSGAARHARPTAVRLAWAAAAVFALAGAAAGQPPDPPGRFRIDSDRFYFSQVRDGTPVQSSENPEEYEAYNDVLLHARQFTAAELEANASRDATFYDLVGPLRHDFRFKLLYFEGRLAQLRRIEPNEGQAAAGIADVYEGWMFPADGSDPMCVVVTELPPGLEPSTGYQPWRRVAVAGYYFKLFRYQSKQKDEKDPTRYKDRLAPLLMARSFTLLPQPEADGGRPWRATFLPGMLGVMAAVVAVLVGMVLLFRRGDRAARRAVERRGRNPFDDEPGPAG